MIAQLATPLTRSPVNDRGNAAGGSSQLGTILDELDWANRDQMWTLRKA